MPAFEKLCLDTYLLALEAFPFMMVANTLHRIFGHASKKMRRMKNRGLVSTQIEFAYTFVFRYWIHCMKWAFSTKKANHDCMKWGFSTNQLQLA